MRATNLQVLKACVQCNLQWEALRRVHCAPPHPKYPFHMPRRLLDILMANTGWDDQTANAALEQAQDQELILMLGDLNSEPSITGKGRLYPYE